MINVKLKEKRKCLSSWEFRIINKHNWKKRKKRPKIFYKGIENKLAKELRSDRFS